MNLSPTFALLQRSLRLESRQFPTYLSRMLLLVVVLIGMSAATVSFRNAPGLIFFRTLMFINLAILSLVGLGLFASAIAEEREEGMLGLLRLTGLDAISILLGKGGSRVLTLALLVLTQFPLTLLAIALGGVSLGQVIAAYCTLGAYVILLGGIGLFCSTIAIRTDAALVFSAIFLAGFFFAPPLGRAILPDVADEFNISRTGVFYSLIDKVFELMIQASPFVRLREICGTGFNQFPIGWQVISNLLVGAAFFALAWRYFDRITYEHHTTEAVRAVGKPKSKWRWLKPDRVWVNALAWKDFHFIAHGRATQWGKFVCYVGLGLFWPLASSASSSRSYRVSLADLGDSTMITALICLGFEALFISSSMFGEEVRWKTLSSLYIMPYSPAELIRRKLTGCLLGLIPVVAAFVCGALLSPMHLSQTVWRLVTNGTSLAMTTLLLLLGISLLMLIFYGSLLGKQDDLGTFVTGSGLIIVIIIAAVISIIAINEVGLFGIFPGLILLGIIDIGLSNLIKSRMSIAAAES